MTPLCQTYDYAALTIILTRLCPNVWCTTG